MKIIFAAVFFIFCINAKSQSKKEIKDLGIISIKTVSHINEKSSYIEKIEKYDAEGNLIEEIKYYPDKSIKSHVCWTYNKNNNKFTEIHYDKNDKIIKKTEYQYNEGLRTSKKEYDEKGKLTEWKTYEYTLEKKSQ